jgi:aryl-phospho-beta-D-glucosidase BglC (GH1 family)
MSTGPVTLLKVEEDTMTLGIHIGVMGSMTIPQIAAYIKTNHLYVNKRWLGYWMVFFHVGYTYNKTTQRLTFTNPYLP